GNASFLLAQAGTIAWRQLGNLIRARVSFERLSALSPEHPQLRAFEAQIGETLQAASATASPRPAPVAAAPAAVAAAPAPEAEAARSPQPQQAPAHAEPPPVAA